MLLSLALSVLAESLLHVQGIYQLPASGGAAVELNGSSGGCARQKRQPGFDAPGIFVLQLKHLLLSAAAGNLD